MPTLENNLKKLNSQLDESKKCLCTLSARMKVPPIGRSAKQVGSAYRQVRNVLSYVKDVLTNTCRVHVWGAKTHVLYVVEDLRQN